MKLYQFNNTNCGRYNMPQFLIKHVYNDFIKKCGYNVELIDNLNINFNKEDIIIFDSYIYFKKYKNVKLIINKCKIIVINLEPIFLNKWDELFKKLCNVQHIIDYSIKNKTKFNKFNKKCTYMPMSYHPLFEQMYNSNINNVKKDIDVLFYGGQTKRRKIILNKLKNKCNLVIQNSKNPREQDLLLQRTKLIFVVFAEDNSCEFDFCRSSYVISNKIALIHEEIADCENIDNIRDGIIFEKYENIAEKILNILNNNNYEDIANKQYNYYKNNWHINKFNNDFKKIISEI